MNEKYSLQYIIEAVAAVTGESKKVAEQFSKAFFDTIVEALYLGESVIKVKGLGTFKLIEVDSRESVNVTNGERITIPAYKKVSFVPDDEITERLTALSKPNADAAPQPVGSKAPGPQAPESQQPSELEAELDAIDTLETGLDAIDILEAEPDAIDKLVAPESIEQVEQTKTVLDGIDLVISTPESIDEIRAQYEEAKLNAEAAIAAAKKANTEKARLEKMLERLEANAKPETCAVEEDDSGCATDAESVSESKSASNSESVSDSESAAVMAEIAEEVVSEAGQQEEQTPDVETSAVAACEMPAACEQPIAPPVAGNAPQPPFTTSKRKEEEAMRKVQRNRRLAGVAALLLIAGAAFFYIMKGMHDSVESVIEADVVENEPQRTNRGLAHKPKPVGLSKEDSLMLQQIDSLIAATAKAQAQADSAAAQSPEGQTAANKPQTTQPAPQNAKPTECVLKKGESLTILSRRYYGTPDSVPAIIRFNRFKDPNKIPVGATIYLP